MFYALAAGKIDTEGLTYVHELQDIESLNQRALRGELEVTAVSIHAYAYLSDRYALLPHGSSMGDKYGPRLVALEPHTRDSIRGKRIAIPGPLTTAYLALKLYQPDFIPVPIPFDEIEAAVLDRTVDLGLLIHEGQLTYAADGLMKVVDLGEWWFERTGGLPLPLGGNIIRRDLGPDLMHKISKMLHDSIAHALNNRAAAVEYAQQFGRGLDRKDTDTFVGMYVNQLTLDYGTRGRAALERFFTESFDNVLVPAKIPLEFA
jgi:1,4-dihydroxy-6-naphthoate synthase